MHIDPDLVNKGIYFKTNALVYNTCSIPGENKFWDWEESTGSLKAIQSRLTNAEITQLTFLKQEDMIGIT